jgi:hypothetical protein
MKRLTLLIPLLLTALFPMFLTAEKGQERDEAPRKIVLIAGSRSHGSGEHEFRAGCLLLAKVLNEQSGLNVEAVVVGRDWPKKKEILKDADAIFIFADGTSGIAGEWEYLDQLARKGVGFTFMHYAVHPSPEQGRKYYQPWIGGAMESGWSVNPHWVADLKVDQDHEISNGVPETVTCLDEFYYNMRFRENRDEVLDLITATPTRDNMVRYINLWNKHGVEGLGKEQTLMWGYERPGGGRGVGFTGGHYHHAWAVDGFRTVVLNALVWSAGLEVPEGGVRSEPLTEEDLNANLDDYGKGMKRLRLPEVSKWKKLPPAKIDRKREAGFN